MRAIVKLVSVSFVAIFLMLSITAVSQSAVESVGEINAKDNNAGTILAGNSADLILSITIDMSQAEPGEEIESIKITVPSGVSAKAGAVKSVTIGDKKIPNFTGSVQDNVVIVTLPTVITLTSRVNIEFTVEASQVPIPQLPFIIGLIAANQRLLVASIKPGNADQRVNNDSLTLKSVSATKPNPPSDVKVQPDTSGENDLIISWSKVADEGISGYLIYRNNGTEPIGNVTGADKTSYTDRDLKPGDYTYTVRSYKTSTLKSDASKLVKGTAPVDKKAPIPPSIKPELKVTDKGIEIDWEPSPSSDVVKYVIYRGVTENSVTKIDEIDSTKNSYIDTKPPESGSYLYVVAAVDESDNEGKSSPTQSRYVVSGDKPQPNPFTPRSPDPRFNQIIFPVTMLKEAEGVFMLKIYDLEGALIFEKEADEGSREIKWDGKDMEGRLADGGIYIYQATKGTKNKIGSIIVAK
jgi:hypothetical protein